MGLESVTDAGDLNVLWPLSTDPRTEGDDHIRAIKVAIASLLTDKSQVDSRHADQEIPTLTTATEATLAHTPNPEESLILVRDGHVLVPGATTAGRYTLSGNTITWDTIVGGEVIMAWYRW